MSKKRFEKSKSDITDYRIYDYEKEDAYFIDCDDESTVDAIVDLINEQQATIRRLQDLCGESDGENAKLRIENKRLEKEVNLLRPTNIEQYEQIQKLQEENEKLKQKVDFYKYFQKDARELEKENEKLRENLHNCRLNKNIISEKLKLWQDVHKEYDIYSIKDFEELMKNDK